MVGSAASKTAADVLSGATAFISSIKLANSYRLVRAWRQGDGQAAPTKAFVPLTFKLGEPLQFS